MVAPGQFRFEYDPATLRLGSGSVSTLADELAGHGLDRALVVCGATVGSTPAVIDPVTEGLGEKLAGVFPETTAEKRLATAVAGVEAVRKSDADVLVGLGGGSSLDLARVIGVLAADDRDPVAVGRELADTGSVSVQSASTIPVVAVPTTLAGAGQSSVAGVTAVPAAGLVEEPVSGGLADPRLMPRAVVYDPALIATTPRSILTRSAMNGFDKAVETLYAHNASSVTDGTALRGLELLRDGLPELGSGEIDETVLEPVVEGILLAQYGVSRAGETTLSLIHAFGHGLTRTHEVQQGAAHAVVAPHVLRYLFDSVDARRELLAEALGAEGASDPGTAVVEAVDRVGDALGLPARLRDVDGPEPSEFPEVARTILDDPFLANAPTELDPSRDEIVDVLRASY
jgi:alcohol dehydrogenase